MPDADEKKARLEAIRAANRAKAEAEGRAPAEASATPAAPAVTEAPPAPVASAPAAPAVGKNMSEDKAARLAAIRAANANKASAPADEATTHPSGPSPAVASAAAKAPAPSPATPAAVAPRPAAKAAPARRRIPGLYKVIGGALFMILVFGLLATTTGNYLSAIIVGGIFGAVVGLMFGSWPPGPGDEVTGGE